MFETSLEQGRVIDASGATLFDRAVRPLSFVARLRGLLGRPALDDGEAWWFSRCGAVHTIGMRHTIDVLHLDARGYVIRIRPELTPLRVSVALRSSQVVELGAGAAVRRGITPGLQLRFVS